VATIKELLTSTAGYTFVNASGANSLAGLANNASWQTTYQDNSTNLWLDALVQVKITTTGAAAAGNVLWVYAYAGTTPDGGTTWLYPDAATGTEGAYTLLSPTNLRLVGQVNAPGAAGVYTGEPSSIAVAFGGTLPSRWGVILQNVTGAALGATIGGFSIGILGVSTQVV
jgi:hypothetical protein